MVSSCTFKITPLKAFPAFLGSCALQNCLLRDPLNHGPKEAKVCPLEVQGGSSSADSRPWFNKDRKIQYLVITLPTPTQPLPPSSSSSPAGEQEIRE